MGGRGGTCTWLSRKNGRKSFEHTHTHNVAAKNNTIHVYSDNSVVAPTIFLAYKAHQSLHYNVHIWHHEARKNHCGIRIVSGHAL